MCYFGNDWDKILGNEFSLAYFKKLKSFLNEEYSKGIIFPNKENIFSAFKLTSFKQTKVVLIGQDPYHNFGQAHGLVFSVPDGMAIPPSLRNIFIEMSDDLGVDIPKSGNLTHWAKQGMLLLNATLTVRKGEPASHRGKGWEIFTDSVIRKLNDKKEMVIFVLWGNDAKKKQKLITNPKHIILKAAHPSPLSAYRGFFGCKHFSLINKHLEKEGDCKIEF